MRSFIRFSVLDEISCGFAVFSDFLRGFSVSNRPLCPRGTLPTERVLGVIYDLQKDAFSIKIKPKELADPLRKAISLTAFKCDPIGFLDHSLCGQKYFLIHCRHFFKAGTRRVRPNCTGKGLFGKRNCRVQWTLQYHGSIALVWFLPAPFSCACLVMQVRKNSVLLHTFDLSIQVERGSALLWLQIPMLHL